MRIQLITSHLFSWFDPQMSSLGSYCCLMPPVCHIFLLSICFLISGFPIQRKFILSSPHLPPSQHLSSLLSRTAHICAHFLLPSLLPNPTYDLQISAHIYNCCIIGDLPRSKGHKYDALFLVSTMKKIYTQES